MRLTVVHNPSAGGKAISKKQICELLGNAGHSVTYRSSKESDWRESLAEDADMIVAAGGDGLVGKVAKSLPQDKPLAVLPFGVANNIATSLGIAGSADLIIAAWTTWTLQPFDLWRATGAFGCEIVVEAVGIGALTDAIARFDKSKKRLDHPRLYHDRARESLCGILATRAPIEVDASLDGRTARRRCILFEVLNLPLVGPNLNLAPSKPGDGWLDVAFADVEQRPALCDWLAKGAVGVAPVHLDRCQQLTLTWQAASLRLDDEVAAKEEGTLQIGPSGRAISVLAPQES